MIPMRLSLVITYDVVVENSAFIVDGLDLKNQVTWNQNGELDLLVVNAEPVNG